MLLGRKSSKHYLAATECWSHYEADRALEGTNILVCSYLTDVYGSATAVSILARCIAGAEYFTLSLGAFLRAIPYTSVGRFAHNQTVGVCEGEVLCFEYPDLGWSVVSLQNIWNSL